MKKNSIYLLKNKVIIKKYELIKDWLIFFYIKFFLWKKYYLKIKMEIPYLNKTGKNIMIKKKYWKI
jgi:hypothetical protein